ncbi:MAG: dihydroorotate dehydrogenase (quinone) [Chloroflexi bacterium HGW-Chloroflexi-1]|nr:MAG: dihydroorotate dehydrogenase (quinone) [Chloroflexi bacterium HGW-Chloroflexi-1]
MYQLLQPLIFRMAPECAHNNTLRLLCLAGSQPVGRLIIRALFRSSQPGPAVEAFGLTFPNPVGLAAGYDKDGLGWRGLAELGFGHIEVGTVTTLPQSGTAGPRVFRLVKDQAVINCMGFPNRGSAFMVKRLQGPRPKGLILGVNIGKHSATPLEEAVGDYLALLRTFAPLADYLAVNVSSPNTPGLRDLQARQALENLLGPLAAERRRIADQLGRPVPLLVKLAPDLLPDALDDALDVIMRTGMDGVIASNTSIGRPALSSPLANERGGLSGAPIKRLNTEFVRTVTRKTGGKLQIVASGGIMSPDDAAEKIDAGATLIQLYTGLIYQGPGLVRDVLEHACGPATAPFPHGVRRRPGLLRPSLPCVLI